MKYQFMAREEVTPEHEEWPIVVMCRVLEVHRSGYYAWRHRMRMQQLGKRAAENQELCVAIREVHRNAKERYGSPRMTAALHQQGYRCSRGRVARLMKANSIKAKRRRGYRITTRSKHNLASRNLLHRDFDLAISPDRLYTTDMTYVRTQEGWLYVATVMDLFSRTIIGLAMGDRMKQELVCDALNQAIKRRQPKPGLLLHSDRGSQYCSWSYRQLLHNHGFIQSMSRKGNCWDNAPMESFFKTLKVEEVYQQKYRTREEAKQRIFDYIEIFYNRQRLHSTLGYKTPNAFEAQSKTVHAQ
jgi:putative transposase